MTRITNPPEGHWRHFRRLVLLTAMAAVLAVGGALFWLHAMGAPMRLHMVIATTLGVGLSVMLGGVLMALVFLSARSGNDAAAGKGEREDRR